MGAHAAVPRPKTLLTCIVSMDEFPIRTSPTMQNKLLHLNKPSRKKEGKRKEGGKKKERRKRKVV